MTVKSSISLTDQQAAFARELVAQGRYSSVSAVVQQGLDLLQQRMDADEADTRALKELLARRESGEFVPFDEFERRLDMRLAEILAEDDLEN